MFKRANTATRRMVEEAMDARVDRYLEEAGGRSKGQLAAMFAKLRGGGGPSALFKQRMTAAVSSGVSMTRWKRTVNKETDGKSRRMYYKGINRGRSDIKAAYKKGSIKKAAAEFDKRGLASHASTMRTGSR